MYRFFLCTLMVLMAHIAFPVAGLTGTPPDTGVTKCYDNAGNQITCPQPGKDYYGQDANYLINPNAFVKLDASGNELPANATSWAMVRDNATGLIWEVKNNKDGTKDYTNPHDADNTYTWYDSNPMTNGGNAGTNGNGTDTEDMIRQLNDAAFGGFTDWRIPTREELRSVVDYSRWQPAINTVFFPNTQGSSGSYYWSSTTYAYGPSSAWVVNFYYGYDDYGYKSGNYYVRAVRGGQ